MKKVNVSLEQGLFLASLIIGASLRFIQLGLDPLTDAEAELALQALSLAKGNLITIGPNPFYILFTGLLFFLFDGSNLIARFLPATAGSLLVLGPMLYRNYLGKRAAIIASLCLSFSPALISASRQAGDGIISLFLVIFAIGFLIKRKAALSGIFSGLALLSGPGFWIILTAILFLVVTEIPKMRTEKNSVNEHLLFVRDNSRQMLGWLMITVLTAGTLFFTRPTGLSALVSSLVAFIRGWREFDFGGGGSFFAFVIIGETLAIMTGSICLIRGFLTRQRGVILVGKLAFINLVLAIGIKELSVIGWFLSISLWVLSAIQFDHWLKKIPSEKLAANSLAVTIFVILVFGIINIAGLTTSQQTGMEMQIRWVSFAGAIVISFLLSILVAWGWSPEVGGFGLRTSFILILSLFLVNNSLYASGLSKSQNSIPWNRDGYFTDADLLIDTIKDFSRWNTRDPQAIDIVVSGIDSDGLRWLLKEFAKVTYQTSPEIRERSSLVITPADSPFKNSASYTGQDFFWNGKSQWKRLNIVQWMQWTLYHRGKVEQERLTLWVRSDQFPIGEATSPISETSTYTSEEN